MSVDIYQIRECNQCGLRYPFVDAGYKNSRCPACLGVTQLISEQPFIRGLTRIDCLQHPTLQKPIAGLLDNIRSALNVGAIFRTADGLGLKHLYLCGFTPTPENPERTKTGLGAQDSIPWSFHHNGVNLVKSIKMEGAAIIVVENKNEAISIEVFKPEDFRAATQVVLVVGNEITGVDPAVIDLADVCVKIPMYGKKSSFNVSNAFAIATYVVSSKFDGIID